MGRIRGSPWPGLLMLFFVGLASSQRIFLNSPDSFVVFENPDLLIGEEQEVLLVVKVKPQTFTGTLFSLKGILNGTENVRLNISLINGFMEVDLFDKIGHKILKKPFSQTMLNTSMEAQINLKIDFNKGTLVFRVDSRGEVSHEISQQIPIEGTMLTMVFGSQTSKSIIGCMELVVLSTKNNNLEDGKTKKIAENDVSECGIEGRCQNFDCGQGRCLDLEVPTCDCSTTGKSGPNCKSEPPTIFVDSEKDQGVWYSPLTDDQKPKKIGMQFKFDPSKEVEGVLLAANLSTSGAMRLFVVGTKGSLEMGTLASLNFTLDDIKGFHSLLINLDFSKNHLKLTADNRAPIELEWKDATEGIAFKQIAFGQSVNQAPARDLGFTGCLRHVFVDHLDILDRLSLNDPRISSYQPIVSCEQKILMGSIGFWPQIVGEMKNGEKEKEKEKALIVTRTTESLVVFSEKDPNFADIFPYGPKQKKPQTKKSDCENADATRCRSGSKCVREQGVPKCECLPNNIGHFCQFSTLPRTCAEAARLGLPRGATRLDLDGSGPLDVSVANCVDANTSIIHDMPPLTPIRDASFSTHSLFVLSYRDFSDSKLATLIAQSETCEQKLKYDCNGAPLNFAQNHTWFHSAFHNRTVHHFGQNAAPRCDSRSPTSDEGILRDFDAGVTRVVALHTSGDIDGRLSLGELQCRGFAKSGGVLFKASATLPTVKWEATHFSFHFRTAQEDAILVTLIAEPRNRIEVRLERGRFIVLLWKSKDVELKVVVETQHQLNDTDWHMLRVEAANEELLLSVDGVHGVMDRVSQSSLPKAILYLGSEHGGLEGCIRSLSIDNQPLDLKDFLKKGQGVLQGCTDHCTTNSCQNEAKCIEDFGNQRAKCICKYPHIHSGSTCEMNLNHASDVSFHGGFLRYSQFAGNPLLDQIVLSARTDQPHALLFFAHDHHFNFVQIHISEEINVTLTLNNRDNVYSCTVTARPRHEFSDMKWIQIVVSHYDTSSTLTIDADSCSIPAERVLSSVVVNQFHLTKTEIDLVEVPVGLYAPSNPEPLLYVFVGGIERDTHSQRNEKRLAPVYQSSIPDLLGCLRGLRIGETIVNLRDTKFGYRPEDSNLIRNGCEFGCSSLSCEHGGHCAVGWRNYDPTIIQKTSCDCTRTSYGGPTCGFDDGIRFDGHSVFEFAVGEILKTVIVEGETKFPQLLKFSFSARVSAHSARQHLATIRFKEPNEKTRFELILNRNGTINAGAIMARGTQVLNFAGNFTDGYRHFIVVQFSKKYATTVMIDSLRKDFDPEFDQNFDLYAAELIEIGGVPEGIPAPQNRRRRQSETGTRLSSNYEGCISNLIVDYQRSRLTFEPFSLLENSAHSHSNKVRMMPNVKADRVRCAKFEEPDALPSYQNTVEFPNWETNFARRDYTGHTSLDEAQSDDQEPNWWLIGLLIAVSLILIILIVLCLWCCCCRKGETLNGKKPEETMPLRSNSFDHTFPGYQQPNHKAKNNFDIPAPDHEFDEKETPSWAGSYDDDFDKTLTEGMDEGEVPHAQHGEELPQIQLQHTSNETTPRNLPGRQGSFRNNRQSPSSPLFSAPPPPSRSPVPVAPPTLSPTNLAKL
ncbi:unnamed protein product, partial [Mesorhabditis belari]|uniref:Uncharacterized protein n=1 Tax=Mesorhabditis belari TaxID=2138241 RepID=A0AAF3EDF3_9BILA